ncbi:PREDICTED: protein yellow isoform X1 [Polistes dominula]|uniref:Protein yellow isoform X1 n=2 Tax=Polistes dominula TaxID=743375 RepID=A0ABM1I1N6_POLDO|nr:PREDICTED: protein yellow isoform X1 [Polistes dominula]
MRRKKSVNSRPMQSSNYFYSSPNYFFDYKKPVTWTNHVVHYQQQELSNQKIEQRNKNRMAHVMPWLLSMSLLGFQQFAAHPSVAPISRELEAPIFPLSDTSAGNLISHEELSTQTSCNSHGNSLETKLIGSTEKSNILYGSTPITIGGFFKPHNRDNPLAIGGDVFRNEAHSINQLEFHGFNYDPNNEPVEDEYVGPAMSLVYAWSTVDFEFDSIEERDEAIFNGDYIAENNLPLGLDIYENKVFITLPKWKEGIPVTLATVPRYSQTKSPKLKPYPNWDWNKSGNCDDLTSVFRLQVDECDRLWVLDSGVTNIADKPTQTCPPALFIFDLRTDTLIRKYTLPPEQVKQDSLFTNIVVDVRDGDCGGAVAYLSDVWRFGIVVYDLYKDSSFRFEHHFFFPDPLAAKYELHGIKFQWTDGIFGIALSPIDIHNDRTLFFHPMSSFREFAVSTSVLRDKRMIEHNIDKFIPIGRPRAKDYGHSSGSVVDRNGVMFFNMVTRDSVWCWDTRKEYIPQNLGVIGTSNTSLVFPNDIKVDHEENQSVWMISNRLPMYLYENLDSSKINFRIFKAHVTDAVKDTICDPDHVVPDYAQGYDEIC